MLQNYLKQLVKDIRTSEEVAQQPTLKVNKWTKSCYDQLSKIITNKLQTQFSDSQWRTMGVTLSSKTLTKIFKGQYNPSLPIDPRSLNTLNKLAIFVNYASWDAYMKSFEKKEQIALKKAPVEEQIIQVVKEAVKLEYLTYSTLPTFIPKKLDKIYLKDAGAIKRILEVVHVKTQAKETLSNAYNPSSYDILNVEVLSKAKQKAMVKTQEFWLLCWWNQAQQKYVQRYKSIAEHTYVLDKNNGHWKIRTNATTTDLLDVKHQEELD